MSELEIFHHKPVLVNEVLEYLNPQPYKTYLDVTFGSGGHTQAILDKEPTCKVIALDWDQKSLDTYGPPLEEKYGDRLHLLWGNFALIYKILKKEKIQKIDGVLADFGTSQMHLMERDGFSFVYDTPLDMRMSPAHQRLTAEQVVNDFSEQKLRELFWKLGEERYAKQIAYAIIQARAKKKIRTTVELANIIKKSVPFDKKQRIHPATRVFQAIRIYVNQELSNISALFPAVMNVLKPGGHFVCISFHSLEDRLVKVFFREQEQLGKVKILTPKAISGTTEEIKENPSARSARLRAIEII